jgi:DNA-binding HxlR family transcriptional regulator
MDDTAPERKQRYYELLRAQTPEQRLLSAVSLSEDVRTLAEAGIRLRHPDADEHEVRRRLIAILYGEEFLRRLRGV